MCFFVFHNYLYTFFVLFQKLRTRVTPLAFQESVSEPGIKTLVILFFEGLTFLANAIHYHHEMDFIPNQKWGQQWLLR